MKHLLFSIRVLALLLVSATAVQSQSSTKTAEAELRKLEAEQVVYLMEGKVVEMKKKLGGGLHRQQSIQRCAGCSHRSNTSWRTNVFKV